MTQDNFNKATDILNQIEEIKRFKSLVHDNPCIKDTCKSVDYMYLSWVDKKDELKNIIIAWCNQRMEELKKEFEEL